MGSSCERRNRALSTEGMTRGSCDAVGSHAGLLLADMLDCYGEDYPGFFLDNQGDIRVDVAVRLGEVAASVASGQLSMWALDDGFEEWMGITITLMDGYGLDDLVELWFEGGASDELGEEEEWPGPSLKTFFNALVDEMARYVAWQRCGRIGGFGSSSTGIAATSYREGRRT
jgi:hypothetical protein